jgi:hypothetical protein
MPEPIVTKKKLDKCVKAKYKDTLDNDAVSPGRGRDIHEEVVTVKKKEIIDALTILEGVKRGLRKVLDKHRT